MILCRHEPHKVITKIKDPKFSTKEILINVRDITDGIEHYIFQFASPGSKRDYGWFYYSGTVIRRHKRQQNGLGQVYVVPLSKREEFVPNNKCDHEFK